MTFLNLREQCSQTAIEGLRDVRLDARHLRFEGALETQQVGGGSVAVRGRERAAQLDARGAPLAQHRRSLVHSQLVPPGETKVRSLRRLAPPPAPSFVCPAAASPPSPA